MFRLGFVVALCLLPAWSARASRVGPDDYVFTTTELPTDDRYMCSVGNGHLSTSVFTDTVYMNGLYNGRKGDSHRARIPAWSNVRLANSTQGARTYSLDTYSALFRTVVNTSTYDIEHRMFAHRVFSRAIVNQIAVVTKVPGTPVTVNLALQPGPASDDILFEQPQQITIEQRQVWKSCGRANESEDVRYQPEPSPVCVYWTEVPANVTVPGSNGTETVFTYVMTADTKDAVARKEMEDVLKLSGNAVFDQHVNRWTSFLTAGYIEISGNSRLSKVVNGAWYYLMSSLPMRGTNQEGNPFYGLSPGGLSRGGYLRDYQGHSFWDTETWMYPAILMMHPGIARTILQYRISNMKASEDLAVLSNHSGTRYAWESAFTGTEVTPDCCPEVVDFEHHVTGDIAYAARQFIAMTGDMGWLNSGGCEFVKKMAEFWASRVDYNNATGFYDINNVMGPDEDHPNVTNSVFTNVVAGYSLYLGEYVACMCNENVPSNWSSIARKLALTYDPELDYHPQNEEYERPTMIKQADAVLLAFPLLYQMNDSTKANNLNYYENVTRDNGPAMTWSMHTIGHLQLDHLEQAAVLFNRSYQRYVREPFYIWTEAIEPEIGAVNFITGMGGFMQAIMSGYAGINVYLDRLEIVKPQMIPDTTELKINGLKYLGSQLTIDITEDRSELIVDKANSSVPLVLQRGDLTIELFDNMRVVLSRERTNIIRPMTPITTCPLPLDLIGQKG